MQKAFYGDDYGDTSIYYKKASGKYALGMQYEKYNSLKVPISTKIGTWLYFDPFGKIIKKEEHEFLGELFEFNVK